MSSKFYIVLFLSLGIFLPQIAFAELPGDIKGPFYYLTKSKSDRQVEAGTANKDRTKKLQEKFKRDVLLGDSAVIDKDNETALKSYHTVYAAAESKPFIFYGGMQGTADTMQSEAMVKLMSQNLTGVVPVYLSAVAMTEPALHDSLTESAAFSQRMVGQMYQQEKHFLGQLESYPVLRRFVQERYKTCVNAYTKAEGGKSWIAAQASCLGDSYKSAEKKFKEIDGEHFTTFDKDEKSKDIVDKYGTGGKTVTSWLFDEYIKALRDAATGGEDGTTSIKLEADMIEEGKKQWLNLVGDVFFDLKPKTVEDTDSHIIEVTKRKVHKDNVEGKDPSKLLDILAEERYKAVLDLVKIKCEAVKNPPASYDTKERANNSEADSKHFEPTEEQLKTVSVPGWEMDGEELNDLYNVFTKHTIKDAGEPNCNLLDKSSLGTAEFRKISEKTGSDEIPDWAIKFQRLAFLLGGADRQLILSGMWRFVASRAGTITEGVGKQAYASVAFSLIQSKSGFGSPEIGLQAVYGGMQTFWDGVAADLNDDKSQGTTGIASGNANDAGGR